MKQAEKPILRALRGETLPVPPVWMMRQAGRYLPEYRKTREQAGSFLDLCYNPDLATEVTLQPIRRYGFDAAILFADILLVPQALGLELSFVQGEGPRLSTITNSEDMAQLRPAEAVHDTLAPVYQTVANLRTALPAKTTLIGFAGAPWTVATYMIAGQGTPDQAPARRMLFEAPELFDSLIARITDATIEYLSRQIAAGAEVVKLFDSWAGALPGGAFEKIAIAPIRRIVSELRDRHGDIPVIGFPRGAGGNYQGFAEATGVNCVALDTNVSPDWAARNLQPASCVQGNLDPLLMVIGGDPLKRETQRIATAFSNGPHIFNLGHGITPDANPDHVAQMLDALRVPA